jgi:TonB-dependent receptor
MTRETQLPGNGSLRSDLRKAIHNVLTRKQETLLGIVGGALLLGTMPALAQEQQSSEELDEVVVTGLRGSLKASMETKREAIGVVDAINAEDIGKFPDSNLSESLQRITGISISRRDGEGALVTARGFGAEFNMVTLNGRMMPAADALSGNAGTSRAFNFANLASEAVSAVEVYKTSKADIATGGIGATINIKTARPLDGGSGFNGSFGVKAVHDTTAVVGDDVTPEVSGIFSFANDTENFGASLSASYQKRESSSAQADENDWRIQRWVAPGQPGAMELTPGAVVENAPAVGQLYGLPNNLVYHFSDRDRERINGQLTLQFRPTDTLLLTGDYTYAENHLQELRGDQGLWFIRTANAVTFDTGQEVATPSFISEDVYQSKDTSYGQELRDQTNKLKSAGFNAEFQATDKFKVSLDFHDSTMESLPTGWHGSGGVIFVVAGAVTDTQAFEFNNGLPKFQYTVDDSVIMGDADNNPATPDTVIKSLGNNNGVFDIPDLGSQPLRLFYQDQVTDITQARLDGALEFEDGKIQFGIETRSMEMNQKGSENYFQLGDWGIAAPGEIPDDLVQNFCVVCQFDDFNHSGIATTGFKANPIPLAEWAASVYGIDPVASRNYNQNNTVKEDTKSVYFQVGMKATLADRPVHVLAGARYEQTDVESTSLLLVPSAIVWTDNNDFRIDRSTTQTPLDGKADYDHLLPSLDVDMEVTDNLKARFSYSKTIARAQYDQMRAAVNINGSNAPTITGGVPGASQSNPALVPLESDNLDLSVEYYFGETSYVAAGFFEKRVSNFIGTEQVESSFFGLRDATNGPRALAARDAVLALGPSIRTPGAPVNETELFVMAAILDNPMAFPNGAADYTGSGAQATAVAATYDITANASDPEYVFLTSRPINNKEAKLHGVELAGQHFFGDTGFGLQANYTIVRGDVSYDNGGDPSVNQFALPGLSDSANFVAMYEKFGLSARLAWNWRDEYLLSSNKGSGRSPEYVEAYQQIDLSVGYDINDHLALNFEALNLTGEDIRTHGRSVAQFWYLEELGPRYALGARYKF